MGIVNKPHNPQNGDTNDVTLLNDNDDVLYNEINGNLDDENHDDITVDDEDSSTWSLVDKPGTLFNRIFTKVKDILGTSDWSVPISLKSINTHVNSNSDPHTTLEKAYPVGSVYINATDSTNPSILLGFGTWEKFGQGKVPVGHDPDDTDFDTAEKTGGEKKHQLTEEEMPSHTHDYQDSYLSDTNNWFSKTPDDVTHTEQTRTTDITGGDQAHNNLQPYITVYMWKRTA